MVIFTCSTAGLPLVIIGAIGVFICEGIDSYLNSSKSLFEEKHKNFVEALRHELSLEKINNEYKFPDSDSYKPTKSSRTAKRLNVLYLFSEKVDEFLEKEKYKEIEEQKSKPLIDDIV